jgi:ribosome biogenesis protein ERB1
MAPKKPVLKRKASTVEVDVDAAVHSDDEFGNGLLEGVLDDDSDDESDASSGADGEDGDEEEGLSVDGDEEDLESDDIPSEGGDVEQEATNGKALHEDEDEGPQYRIETDANGGTRFVCYCLSCIS